MSRIVPRLRTAPACRAPLPALLFAAAAAAAAYAQTADYPLLDHVQGSLVQTNAAPVRPLLMDSNGTIWAVNTGLSTVERFAPSSPTPIDVRQVPWGPVAIAQWVKAGQPAQLLIVCRNTWGLLRMTKSNGAFLDFIALPAEPSDIVVTPGDQAFISCTGADAVVRIDLNAPAGTPPVVYDESTTGLSAGTAKLRIKSPYFLALDADGSVIVAPLHSGNNTTAETDGTPGSTAPNAVVSLADRPAADQLPDEDLFRIDPTASVAGSVSVLATGVGTLLFGHGRAQDGKYWVLNTDARNADPARQSEPALGADFIDTRATLITGSGSSQIKANAGFDLDDAGYSLATTLGQPFALAFNPHTSHAFAAGLLTDNVAILGAAGERLGGFDLLSAGAIPRGVVVKGEVPPLPVPFVDGEDDVAVYCWGSATVEVWRVTYSPVSATPLRTHTLSHDPLPANLKAGRRTFFDGSFSARGNLSCASCHVDGGTDFLAWNLSGLPFDNKGPMVTQTLVGLARVAPFHWRGERTFEEFNTFAFPGLLGAASPLPEAVFDDMKAWVFALVNPANPFQHRTRKVDGSRSFTSEIPSELATLNPANGYVANSLEFPLAMIGEGDPIAGLGEFQTVRAFEDRHTCLRCHSFPVGTNNDIFDTPPTNPRPERTHFKNAPFHEIWRKKQGLEVVDARPTSLPSTSPMYDIRARLGAGLSHSGQLHDIARFFEPIFFDGPSPQDPANRRAYVMNVASFIQQWDQGLGQAAHAATLLPANAATSHAAYVEVRDFLLAQASSTANPDGKPNCDIAVLQISATNRQAWFLDRALLGSPPISESHLAFAPAQGSGSAGARRLLDFAQQPEAALFVGLPVGMAEQFAVDFDMDGLRNLDDAAAPFTINPELNDLAPPPGITVQKGWTSSGAARIYVTAKEPCTVEIDYGEGAAVDRTVKSPALSRFHALMLPDLRPSTDETLPASPIAITPVTYSGTVTIADAWGNAVPLSLASLLLQSGGFTMPPNPPLFGEEGATYTGLLHEHVLTAPPVVALTRGTGNVVLGTITLTTRFKQGTAAAAPGRAIAVRLFRRPGGTGAAVAVTANQLTPTGSTVEANQLRLRLAGGTAIRNLVLSGGVVALNTALSNASGVATLTFRLPATFAAGDVILAGVDAIVETTSVQSVGQCLLNQPCTYELAVADLNAASFWDFPRTKEANFVGAGVVP